MVISNFNLQNKFKLLWSKKARKSLIFGIIASLILIVLLVSFAIYKTNNPPVTTKINEPDSTSFTANVADLELGSPLTLLDENGNRSLIQNGQVTEVAPGKYTLQSLIDGNGGEVRGVKENIEVKNNEKKQLSLSLKPITLDENKALAKALTNPSETKQILNIKPVESKSNNTESSTSTTAKITYPNLILPNSGNSDVAAVVQSAGAKYSLVDSSNIVLPNQNSVNNSNSTTPKLSLDNQNPAPSNIPKESSSVLVAQDKNGQVTLAQGCEIAKVGFDNTGKILKYFKACDNGQNGFYQYNLDTKTESQVLPTSDSSNQIKVDNSSTQDLMVWTKPEIAQFGIIQNGKSETILTNTYFTAPTFSPDGKYIIVMDNYLSALNEKQIKELKLSNSTEDQFGMKVRVVSTEDLLKNKDKANFKQVGTTYYIPRPIDYSFDFIYFIDDNHFMAGDSSKIFSLNGEKEDSRLVSDQPGRVFESKSKARYRLYQNSLFNSKNEPLVGYVSKIYQLQNKDFYFRVGDFLFRLVDDIPVQAYSKPISSISISNNSVQLILTDGKIIKF